MSLKEFISEITNMFVEKALSLIMFDFYDKPLYDIDDVISIECNTEKTLKELNFKNNEFETFGKILLCNNYIKQMDKKLIVKQLKYENNNWLYIFENDIMYNDNNNTLTVLHKYMNTIYINKEADKGT